MKCEHAQELLSDYAEGSLDRPLALAVDQHIAECAGCAEAASGMKALWPMLQAFPAVEPPAGFHSLVITTVSERCAAPAARVRPGFRERFWNIRTAGAFALAAVCIGSVHLATTQNAEMNPFADVAAWVRPHPAMEIRSVQAALDSGGSDVGANVTIITGVGGGKPIDIAIFAPDSAELLGEASVEPGAKKSIRVGFGSRPPPSTLRIKLSQSGQTSERTVTVVP